MRLISVLADLAVLLVRILMADGNVEKNEMELDYEIGRQKLLELAEWYTSRAADRNEATTRFQLIDQLLFECLQWPRDAVVMEQSEGGEYTDYTFLAPRRVLIVEAKREGDYFEVPAGRNQLDYSIPSLTRDNPSLRKAIEQAAGYCQSRGVPFGAVCNGHQLVAFVAVRSDGLSPLEGKALVFPSLAFQVDHFLELWQAVSKPGIEQKKLQERLIGDILPGLPPKLSTTIAKYPGIKGRNIFQTDLQIVSDLVIEDVTRSRDLEVQFLRDCYCQSGAL